MSCFRLQNDVFSSKARLTAPLLIRYAPLQRRSVRMNYKRRERQWMARRLVTPRWRKYVALDTRSAIYCQVTVHEGRWLDLLRKKFWNKIKNKSFSSLVQYFSCTSFLKFLIFLALHKFCELHQNILLFYRLPWNFITPASIKY